MLMLPVVNGVHCRLDSGFKEACPPGREGHDEESSRRRYVSLRRAANYRLPGASNVSNQRQNERMLSVALRLSAPPGEFHS